MITMGGTMSHLASSGTFDIPMITMESTAIYVSTSKGTFIIPMPIFGAESYPFSMGTFHIPMLQMMDVAPYHSYGSMILPTPELEGYARLTPVSPIYRGVVMNLINQAISTYSNYPFNSLAYYNKKYLGATSSGIYVLDTDNDNGANINAHIKTGPMDLGEKLVKHIRDVWITHRTDGRLAIVFSVDEDDTGGVERVTQLVGEELQEEKVKVPRGLKGRYYTMEFKNISGADFDLDSLEVMVDILGGKKR